ncbi:amino acid adenylation domain-containing protein [Catellatospora sp. KI3]|uniref:non-ribosomal peptide synthetase/type I polyketide synthase n=1 Tax=Catellatospora sp. KI3 TaxID=3041620 RepID=UPI0024827D94|nr:non-ribosomal peptide synthetase/type I polyketide synthase [Catellatospora sp. KI3]MDI1463732.1 amino acid adenylation domain-containing protein [Catellatospora sp. KI3]
MSDDNQMPVNAVAVVGMALRVPGASTPDEFWRNLREGVESIAVLTPEQLLAGGATAEEIAHPDHVPALGVLDDPAGFDARFFGFSAREAQLLDPQHRLFLECAWEALEHAGLPADSAETVTGVYAGVGESSYLLHNLLPNADLVARVGAFQTSLGNDKDFVPTRVSYKLNLHGPSVSVQTGCSTSLVAVHMAGQALAAGECDVALAGGATILARTAGYRYEPGGILSPDGHVRAFDAAAGGAVPGSGVGVVVLKRLADALADGDVIHAVIRGSAINNDGARKVGFTAPSIDGQADVIAEALGVAEVEPSSVSYVEAHGTGTPIGDPIEVAALKSVFADSVAPVALGSVKTNVGHLDTAAGVVGLIKTVLALRARELPPTLHFSTPNPQLGLDDSPFHVPAVRTPWHGDVLRAGVSSFGIGGTNAHVVLEQAPPRAGAGAGRRTHVLPLSAATATALDAAAANLAAHLRARPEESLAEVAYTLQRGRRRLPYRRFVVAATAEQAAAALEQAQPARTAGTDERAVVFAFPGQGAQRPGMGRGLYEREPVYRAALDRVADLLLPVLGADLRDVLHPAEGADADAIHQTRLAQPALFAVGYALAELWRSWGVRPAAMIGHSVGELVAACLAGVMSVEDAARLIAVRGELMQQAPGGAMTAVPLPEAELAGLLPDDLALAAVNGPRQCTVSGPVEAVERFEAALTARGTAHRRLRTSHAFHSPAMGQAAAAFEAEVARVRLSPPRIPFASNVTGTWITDAEATSPAYWGRQLSGAVRFDDGLRAVCPPDALLLEAGPGRTLTGLARPAGLTAVASLPGDGDAEAELLAAAGALWRHGTPLAWDELHPARPNRTVLPTYPFERERYWIDPPAVATVRTSPDGLSVRAFRRTPPATAGPGTGTWLLHPDGGLLDDLAARLRADGADVRTLAPGADPAAVGGDRIAAVVCPVQSGGPTAARTALDELTATLPGGTRVIAVTSGALDVTGAEPLDPGLGDLAAWAVAAPGRTLLDVPGTGPTTALIRAVRAELTGAARDSVVALRGGHRFVAGLEPVDGTADPARHLGTRYTVHGNPTLGQVFAGALAKAGAVVSDADETAATALLLLDATAPAGQVLQNLAAATYAVHDSRVRACEVHLVGDADTDAAASGLAGLVEAHTALTGRAGDATWTTIAWPRGDRALLGRDVARVVGAVSGGHVVVAPRDHDGEPGTDRTADTSAVAYADAAEREVAAIFTDLLGEPDIDPTAGFFELGGHSLLAAQFVTQVRQSLGVEIALRTFVAEPTIRGLARAVRQAREEAGGAAVEAMPAVAPDPARSAVPFPLTDVQQAYWIGRTGVFDLGNVGMHGYEEFDVPDLDLPRLQHALRRLIARHGMLRAIVLPHGEQQILAEVPDYVIATEDVRGQGADVAAAVLDQTRAAMSHQVFVPDRWPLFELRATVLDDRTRLHYSIDGLITDAWASSIVLRELTELYHHPEIDLPELELSFRDYVVAATAMESTDRFKRAAAYWHERLPELATAPDLPLARDPATIEAPRFRRWEGQLDRQRWERVKAQASRRGITPTVLLLTAYSEVLATWSKNRRFTLNLPMANRLPLHPQVEEIIGDFTSVTLLEIDADSAATFEARAHAIRDQLVTDLDHRLFSGVRVTRDLKRLRGDAAATMPVVFTSLFASHGEHTLIGDVVYSISQTPQIWIDAQVYEVDGALTLDIDAVDGLFPDDLVAAMHQATLAVVRRLADDDSGWGGAVPSLVPAAQLAAQEAYNRTDGLVPAGLLHEPFFAAAARTPDLPAVITPDRTLGYGELAARARGVAAGLAPLGLRPNDLVAVVMEKGWEQVAAVLGILAAGAAYLPIDPELPDERVAFLLEHSRARGVLTQSRLAAGGRFAGVGTVLAVDELPPSEDAAPVATTPGDLAYVIFTSGSTGLPKGVMIDHRGALNTVRDVNDRFGVGGQDRVLALSSLSFDLSVYDVFGPLAVGGAVVMPDAGAHRDPAAWLDLVTDAQVTVWNSVPALMELFVEHMTVAEATAKSIRLVMMSGDWIPVSLPDRIRQVLGAPEIVSLGGATEASIWSILYPIGDVPPEWASIPYGRPMRNQTFHVLDDALRPRPTWVPGQLYIGGVGLALGYLHDGAKTSAAFITHPETGQRLYRTGDLGRFLPSGDIEFLGREDFQVKVQGYRIELGEIEAAFTQHPGIRAAVVVAQGEPRGAKRLVAFVVPQAGQSIPEDTREFLTAKLPGYMVPGVYLELDALPLTANGKVDRRALVVPDDAADLDAPAYEAPRTPVEEAIAEIWAGLLGLPRVGVRDNFFLLGGDSLMAMRAVVHLRKALDIDVPIRVLFDSPTLEDTALAVEEQLLAELENMTDEQAQARLAL